MQKSQKMFKSSSKQMNTKHLLSFLTTIGVISLSPSTHAQNYEPTNRIPVADNSRIGTQVVETTSKNFTITGGVNLGQNLLHSFTDFSVPTGGAATFDNSLGKQSIITRVTGGNFSDINGLVNTQGANFFLINPNGIMFGTNAQLNVGQTFVGSTANGIDLVDAGGRTVNFGTNRSGDDLLTINPNALFNVSRLNMGGGNGQISNFGTLQTANPNQYIGLIGGNVSLNEGQIDAPGGRVELGGLSAPGAVTLGVEGNNFRAQFPANVTRGDVSLTNQAGVRVPGVGGGDIAISAKNLEILGDSFVIGGIFPGFGTPESVAGDIKVNATGDLVLSGSNSRIVNQVGLNSRGQSGNITIEAGSVSLRNGAQIAAPTLGQGNAGNVKVTAKNAVSLTGRQTSILSTVEAGGVGTGGSIDIDASSFLLQDGAQLSTLTRKASTAQPAGQGSAGNINVKVTGSVNIAGANNELPSGMLSYVSTGGTGNGGNITIDAGSFDLRDGALLETSTFGQGNAGNVSVRAKDAVSLAGTTDSRVVTAGIFSTVESGGVGKGGDINITAASLSLRDGAQLATITRKADINANKPAGRGDAGNVTVKVTGAVNMTGSKNEFPTGISSYVDTGTVGNGGNITVEGGSLSLRDGAQLRASTYGMGNAGNITLKVTEAVDMGGTKNGDFSVISSSVSPGAVGNGGNITVEGGSISLGNYAVIGAATGGQGEAGSVIVNASDFVSIVGRSGLLVTSTSPTGNAGDIIVTSPKITLDSGARIEAASISSNGGNIQIGGQIPPQFVSIQGNPINPAETKLLILRRGAQISTNASGTTQEGSNGGNITITAPNGFIVTAPNENSDISANGFSGSGGKVTINTQQNFWISPLSRAELERLLGTTDPNLLNPFNLPTNNITAISQVNPTLNGQVTTTPPEIDPSRGLSPLPNNVTDPSNQIDPNCSAKAIANNSFTNVGRGGIPATPKDPLNEQEIATNWVRLNPKDAVPSTPIAATPASPQPFTSDRGKPIVEAQGWRQERNGDIVLVAGSSIGTLPRPAQPQSGCVR
jgi:filamentous hemagglutinin family protein